LAQASITDMPNMPVTAKAIPRPMRSVEVDASLAINGRAMIFMDLVSPTAIVNGFSLKNEDSD